MSSMVVKQHENMMKGMMVTDLNMGTFTKEEVLRAYDEMGRMTSRIELLSPNVAVVMGKNWFFNHSMPLERSLHERLEQCSGNISYARLMASVRDAVACSYVGKSRVRSKAEQREGWLSSKLAVDKILSAFNQSQPEGGIRLSAEARAVTSRIIGSSFGNVHSQLEQDTYIYVHFPEEPKGPKLSIEERTKAVKYLLDLGAISETDYSQKIAEILGDI